jgi:hypothetical protein
VDLRLLLNHAAFVVDDAKDLPTQRSRYSLKISQVIREIYPTPRLSIVESADAEIL